jgi:hypothetical protein
MIARGALAPLRRSRLQIAEPAHAPAKILLLAANLAALQRQETQGTSAQDGRPAKVNSALLDHRFSLVNNGCGFYLNGANQPVLSGTRHGQLPG